jgi:antitoxin component YwqK of YwqJK toxin-antitoxin module
MKRILSILVFIPLFAASQRNDTVMKFLNANLEFTSEQYAVYYGVAVKRTEGWFLYALYPDTTPLLKVHYKDRALKVKEGHYASYYPGNRLAHSGHYHNNMKTGIWQSWYENGQRKDSGFYTDNYMTGIWKRWYENGSPASVSGYLSTFTYEEQQRMRLTGQVPESGARDGSFVTWYPNGNKESEGVYRNSLLQGRWLWYHENGKLSTEETYSNGVLSDLTCFDSSGKESGNLCGISKPAVLKGIGDFRSFLMENLSWPPEAIKNRIEGTVWVSFSVDKNGKLQGLYITGLSNVLRNAVNEFFQKLPDWEPAVSHNRVVEWKEMVEIPFYLDD